MMQLDKDLLSSLRLAHGAFNFIVMLLFWHQARLGIRIRKARRQHAAMPFEAIKQHRKSGPVYAVTALLGYAFGIVLVILDEGHILEHPAHFFTGTILMAAIITSFLLSRRIKGQQASYRTPHFAAGILILVLFFLQVLLGIGVLF